MPDAVETEMKSASFCTVHGQPLAVVTATVEVPPSTPNNGSVDSVREPQKVWVTVKACPPIVNVPVRGPPAATL